MSLRTHFLIDSICIALAIGFASLYFLKEDCKDSAATHAKYGQIEQIEKCEINKDVDGDNNLAVFNANAPKNTATFQSKPEQSARKHNKTKRSKPKKSDRLYVSFVVDSRLSAIGKFISLTEDQKKRLRKKFELEASKRKDIQTESLEDILGKEDAEYFRAQRAKAFEKARNEEIEKEVLLLSRKLSLTREQENELRTIIKEAEKQKEEWKRLYEKDQNPLEFNPDDPRQRVIMYVKAERYRDEIIERELKEILTPEQFQLYLKEKALSPSAEMEIWHDLGE